MMKLPVDAHQLTSVLRDGVLPLYCDTSGDFNSRMATGKHRYTYRIDGPATACLHLIQQLPETFPSMHISIGSLITEIHTTVPVEFYPAYHYDNVDEMLFGIAPRVIEAVIRAMIRPRLQDKCPKEIFLQGCTEENHDAFVQVFENIVRGDGSRVHFAYNQNHSSLNKPIHEICSKRNISVDTLCAFLRTKWQ